MTEKRSCENCNDIVFMIDGRKKGFVCRIGKKRISQHPANDSPCEKWNLTEL